MQCQAFSPSLSLPFPSLFLSNPSPPLILSFSPQPFYCRPSFGALLLLLYATPPIPQARLQHLPVYLYVFSLPALSALPFTRLLSASICHPGVFVSLYLR